MGGKNLKEISISDKPHKSTQKTPSIEPISQPVYYFCCLKTGSITLPANVETKNVFINEKLQIEYAVRNNSTSELKAIEVGARKIQNFHADIHHCVLSSVTYQTRFENSKGIHTDANIEPPSNGVRVIEANIPNDCPSYNGHLGNVSYVIEVRVFTPTCSVNPEVTIPITLFDNRVNFAVTIPNKVPFTIADWHATAIVSKIIKDAPTVAHKWILISRLAPIYSDLPSLYYHNSNESDSSKSSAISCDEISHKVGGHTLLSRPKPLMS